MPLLQIVYGVAPPIALALLALSRWGGRCFAVAAALGALVAYGLLFWRLPGWPHELWHDPNGIEWLLWGLCAAALLRLGGSAGVLVDAGLAAAVVWLLTRKVAASWALGELLLHVGGAGLAVLALAWTMRRQATPATTSVLPWLGASVLLSVDAALLTLGKSALLGQLTGAFAAAFGAAAGARLLWRKDLAFTAPIAGFVAVVHTVLLLAGPTLAYLPWREAGMAAAGPLLMLLLPRGLCERRPGLAAGCAAVLAVVPGIAALWLLLGEANPYGY